MARILVIALIIYLLIRIFKGWAEKNKLSTSNRPSAEKPTAKKMVRCEVCQLHIPENEAILNNGKYYCCSEHYNNRKN